LSFISHSGYIVEHSLFCHQSALSKVLDAIDETRVKRKGEEGEAELDRLRGDSEAMQKELDGVASTCG
jgi:hypothetical protein